MRRGMTLIEILVVITIIMVVMGLVLTGVSVLRKRAAEQKAANAVTRLHLGLEALILEQGFPTGPSLGYDGSGVLDLDPVSDAGGSYPSLLTRLVGRGLFGYEGGRDLDRGERRLVDPWRQPYLLVTGADADPQGHVPQALADDALAGWVPVNAGATPDYRLYVYSYGPRNPSGADAVRWIVYRSGR